MLTLENLKTRVKNWIQTNNAQTQSARAIKNQLETPGIVYVQTSLQVSAQDMLDFIEAKKISMDNGRKELFALFIDGQPSVPQLLLWVKFFVPIDFQKSFSDFLNRTQLQSREGHSWSELNVDEYEYKSQSFKATIPEELIAEILEEIKYG